MESGAGISGGEHLPHVFDRFRHAIGSTGAGLGLAIAKGIVEAHGGQIRAESIPSERTALTNTLPTTTHGRSGRREIVPTRAAA